MEKRVLTIEVEFESHPEAAWIWEAHKENKIINGVKIKVIAEGSLDSQIEEAVAALASGAADDDDG